MHHKLARSNYTLEFSAPLFHIDDSLQMSQRVCVNSASSFMIEDWTNIIH